MYSPVVFCAVIVGLCASWPANAILFGGGKACYDRIGCFSKDAPFTNTGKTPDSPSHINAQFLLYTRHNPTSAYHLSSHEASNVRASHFNAHKNTKFIIHGYQDSGTTSWIKHMTSEILKHSMRVEFSAGIKPPPPPAQKPPSAIV